MDRGRSRATWRRIAAGVTAIAVLTACGDNAPADTASIGPTIDQSVTAPPSPTDAPTTQTTETTDMSTTAASFPVTVTGANGDVTIDERPERIVVLSSSLTETAFAVGAGEQVVAVDSYSDFPADAPATDLSGFKPNVEAIGAYDPDLVLVSRDRDDIVATLEGVGIQTLVLPSAADLDEVYAQVETIGIATGHPDEGAALSASMRTQIDEQFDRLEGITLPTDYFYELSSDSHSATSDTFVGSILSELRMANIADGVDPAAGPYPQLSTEYVLDVNPEQIFVAHTDGSLPTIEEIAARPGWSTLQAVADGNIVLLDPDIASRWGPRVVDLVTAIVNGLVAAP